MEDGPQAAHLPAGGEGGLDPIVAVDPGHLLHQVGLSLDVGPADGGQGPQALGRRLHPEVQSPQGLGHGLGGELGPQEVVGPLRGEGDPDLGPGLGVDVDPALGHRSPGQLGQEGSRPVQGERHQLRVEPLLEAQGGLGAEAQLAGGAPDGRAVEGGRLQDYIPGAGVDLRLLPAHDARDHQRLAGAGDEEHLWRQGPLHPVQGDQPLPGPGPPDDQGRLAEAPSRTRSASKAWRGWPISNMT